MADENSEQFVLVSTYGTGFTAQLSGTVDQTGANYHLFKNVAVPESGTAIELGSVTAPYDITILNNHASGYIEVDHNSNIATFPHKILSGQLLKLHPEGGVLYWKGSTSSMTADIIIRNQ